MKRRVLAVLLVAAMALSLAACGSSSDDSADASTGSEGGDEISIGVLLKPESNEYWSSMKAGMLEWADEQEGVTVEVLCAEDEDNTAGQLEQLQNMIGKDYDAICVAPLSESNLVEGVIAASEAGIPIVDVDEAVDVDAVVEGGGNMYKRYTTENISVGNKAGEFICEQLGGSGDVAIIQGTAAQVTSQQRSQGAEEALTEGGCTVVASQPANWDRLEAIDVATNIMQSNPDLKAFYAANDTMALGVYEAVVNADKADDIIVVGTDGTSNGIQSVADGEMAASIGQDNVGIGIACLEAAVEAVQNGWDPTDTSYEMPVEYIDSFLISADNAQDYL